VEAKYKSGRALAVATVVLLTLMTMLMLANAAVHLLTMRQLGTFDDAGAEARLALFSLLRWSTTAAHLATATLFLMWVYRATANLPALGAPSTRFTPARAVKVFFIPFVNLVRVYQVMAMIWTESQSRTLADAGHSKPRSIVIVIAWYALGLSAVLVDAILSVRSVTVGVGIVPQMASVVLTATAAIVCAIMVYTADARQRAQAEDLERRANVPQPTGAELR
jgi:hypothetical protein